MDQQPEAEWNVAEWHGKLNYTPPDIESGRRLARR
jgi:hypothetical protein